MVGWKRGGHFAEYWNFLWFLVDWIPPQIMVFCISVRSGSDIANNYKQAQIIVSHGEPNIYPHCLMTSKKGET